MRVGKDRLTHAEVEIRRLTRLLGTASTMVEAMAKVLEAAQRDIGSMAKRLAHDDDPPEATRKRPSRPKDMTPSQALVWALESLGDWATVTEVHEEADHDRPMQWTSLELTRLRDEGSVEYRVGPHPKWPTENAHLYRHLDR